MLSDEDRKSLLGLARDAVAAAAGGNDLPTLRNPNGPLREKGAVFVTLRSGGDLRGCIGHIEANEPLGKVVPRCAVAAGNTDPRFPPITRTELDELDIEISLLGPLEPIAGPEDIAIGRHGLVVEMGWQRGLLLPQVATEWSWDAETFLSHTCHKAGLPRDAWKHGAKLWRFDAEVFGER